MQDESIQNLSRAPVPETQIVGMFTRIAPRYDLLNRLMTVGQDRHWRHKTARALDLKDLLQQNEPAFLDIAAGTGDLALALFDELHVHKATNFKIYLLDPSAEMLKRAREKIQERGIEDFFSFHAGTMEELPFPAAKFSGITIGFGIRNAIDRGKSLGEILRVLKPNGRLAVLEAIPPQKGWQRLVQRLHTRLTIPTLATLFSEVSAYHYLGNSIQNFPTPEHFLSMLLNTGFSGCRFEPLALGAIGLFTAENRQI